MAIGQGGYKGNLDEISRSLESQSGVGDFVDEFRNEDSYRASASPDPVIGFSSPSTQFGDDEFLHEIGMYGASDPVLRASLRAFGADPARLAKFRGVLKPNEMSEMASPFLLGQAKGFNEFFGTWSKNPYARVNQAFIQGHKIPGVPKVQKHREHINDAWRHEYRHLGLDLVRSNQEAKWGLMGRDYPLDASLRKAFSPGLLNNVFPTGAQKKQNEEALMRYYDFQFAQSFQKQKSNEWLENLIKEEKVTPDWDYINNTLIPSIENQIAWSTYKNNFPINRAVNDPASWITRKLGFEDK